MSDSGEVLLVQGLLRSADQADQLKEYLEKTKIPYVNMTSLAGVQQVQLQVRVAEVSRTAMQALGINAFDTGTMTSSSASASAPPGGAIVPSIDIGAAGPPASIAGPLAFATPENGIGVQPSASRSSPASPRPTWSSSSRPWRRTSTCGSWPNPTLVALSGEEADFLAGGEFPIPVVQGTARRSDHAITIEYKEFGVRLIFRPVVLGDGAIRLRAMQEVSELTDVGAVAIQGFSRPRPDDAPGGDDPGTQERPILRDGRLAPATPTPPSRSRIPGLGDLPIIGPLFRSVRYQNEETELVILVTASLVEPMSVAAAPPLPGVPTCPRTTGNSTSRAASRARSRPSSIRPARTGSRTWVWTSSSAPAPGTRTSSKAIRPPPRGSGNQGDTPQ